MSNDIILAPFEEAVGFTDIAKGMLEDALIAAAGIGRVTNPKEQEFAVAAQSKLNEVIKAVENARKAAVRPYLDKQAEINQKAKSFSEEAKSEIMRVSGLISEFQELEEAKARSIEQAEVLEAENLDASRQRELAGSKSLEEFDAINERYGREQFALASNPGPIIPRVEGQVIKHDWDIKVTDWYELVRHHPQCVKMTERVSEIKSLLDMGQKVHGVEAKRVVKSGVRKNAPQVVEA